MSYRVVRPPEAPLDDEYEALRLMARPEESTARPQQALSVASDRRAVRGWRVRHGSDRRVWSYYLTERCAAQIIGEGWVTRGRPQWGYTDETERSITEHGEREHMRHWEQTGAAMAALGEFLGAQNQKRIG